MQFREKRIAVVILTDLQSDILEWFEPCLNYNLREKDRPGEDGSGMRDQGISQWKPGSQTSCDLGRACVR